MAAPCIEVHGLSKKYRLGKLGAKSLAEDLGAWFKRPAGAGEDRASEMWALRDVSFSVESGEVVGVIGRNGSGKSTLLKILSRITDPTEGEARLRGRVASLLEVGTGFHPELTGRENVFLNGAILGMKRREITEQFDAIVDFSGMVRAIDTPVKRYSSGERVRLAFSVAAHLQAEILIIDEVLAVGDVAFQKQCLGKMQDVSRHGRTVLFVSHNMQMITTLTDRCFLLREGRLIREGETGKVVNAYLQDSLSRESVYESAPAADEPSITHVSVETSEPGSVHVHGKPLRIRVEAHTPKPIEGGQLSIQVCNAQETPVLHFPLYDEEVPFFREGGTYDVHCLVPDLKLYLGGYHLKVHLGSTRGHRHFQTVSGICPFSVAMHGIERLWPWRQDECVYLEPCQWEARKLPLNVDPSHAGG